MNLLPSAVSADPVEVLVPVVLSPVASPDELRSLPAGSATEARHAST